MLEKIYVRNVALIEEAEMDFSKGLNILTGETGAGKSILIGSVQMALGNKVEKSIIREGAEYAMSQLLFSVDTRQEKYLQQLGIEVDEEQMVLLERRIYKTKSICKINSELVTLKKLQEITRLLINIHGQRENQVLLKTEQQIDLLDEFGGSVVDEVLHSVKKLYEQYQAEEIELSKIPSDENEIRKKLDFLQFEYNEIEEANLKVGEDDKLEEEYTKLQNGQKILDGLHSVLDSFYQDDYGLQFQLSKMCGSLSNVSNYDKDVQCYLEQMNNLKENFDSLICDINDFKDSSILQMDEYTKIENRLNVINHLKEKHGKTIEEILEYQEELSVKITTYQNVTEHQKDLLKKHSKTENLYREASSNLHRIRLKYSEMLSEDLKNQLLELNFNYCEVKINCESITNFSSKGMDEVEFYISLNVGEKAKPLSQIASGGELSRIMLAIKTIFADKDQIATLIFDEIDTGISGETAWKVAQKLAVLRKHHQIICITHLPQIAAMSDCHYKIYKDTKDQHTLTHVSKLTETEDVMEIARLLGTNMITDSVINNAKEMKDLAEQTKQY